MKRIRQLGNKGFSLLELLLAVVILGIIVTPLLKSFIVSANVSRKTHDVSSATMMAENIAEAVEAVDLRNVMELIDRLSQTTGTSGEDGEYDTVTYAVAEADQDIVGVPDLKLTQIIKYLDLPSTSTYEERMYVLLLTDEDSDYSARVTLNPMVFKSINQVKVTKYQPMDAVFLQPSDTLDPDKFAAETLKGAAEADAKDYGDTVSLVMTGSPSRTIKVEIVDGGLSNYSYSCTYHYEWGYSFTWTVGETTYSKTVSAAKNVYDITYQIPHGKNVSTSGENLNSLYIFYTPNAAGDTIEILHRDPDYTPSVRRVDNSYLNQICSVDVFVSPQTLGSEMDWETHKVFINLKDVKYGATHVHVDSDKAVLTKFRYRPTAAGNPFFEGTRSDPDDQLVSVEAADRMFKMNIEVYSGTELVLAMDGAKLN